jgi:5'-nucleotidase
MAHRIFCNRTLNLRAIKAIGYDMDYTLIHYRVSEWEKHAYAHVKGRLVDEGWPIADLEFDERLMIRGLIIDKELGNILKVNRFGFVKKALHGTRPLEHDASRETYTRVIVDLSEGRFEFMNTLFSMSEACLYAQLIDRYDAAPTSLPGIHGYEQLYKKVRRTTDQAHVEGKLKGEIIANPDRFVDLDPGTALALLDQKYAGKKLLLITNSEWPYTKAMMSYAFDRFLPKGMTWRQLFDLVIIEARKPVFFTNSNPIFEVVNEEGLLKPSNGMRHGGIFLGGHAAQVEECLGLVGDQILYVGDHIFSDVHVSKNIQRWRTALILRELEEELEAQRAFEGTQKELERLMEEKERLEAQQCTLRLEDQRTRMGYGPKSNRSDRQISEESQRLRNELMALDIKIGPLAKASSEISSAHWGLLMRAGNDKSHLARQVERYADIYLSRVAHFAEETPFVYLRSARGDLPHDPAARPSIGEVSGVAE